MRQARLYAASSARIAPRALRKRRFRGGGMLFVLGSPRSGTTFLASAIGEQPDVVDLDEVAPLKAAIPHLVTLPPEEAAPPLRRTLELVRLLSLSFGVRGVEQTPETAFVLEAALRAYPDARAVHVVRDGRDVVCSLLERGWLNATRGGADDAGLAYGAHPRFWVEPERVEEFARVSDARRCAWAWRRYLTAARAVRDARVLEVRYETLRESATQLAEHLGLDSGRLDASLAQTFTTSVGRWRRDLDAQQLADVEAEAGPLLAELGYGNAGGV
jgi:hypothetical protein